MYMILKLKNIDRAEELIKKPAYKQLKTTKQTTTFDDAHQLVRVVQLHPEYQVSPVVRVVQQGQLHPFRRDLLLVQQDPPIPADQVNPAINK